MAEAKSEIEVHAEILKIELGCHLERVAEVMRQAHADGFEVSFNVAPVIANGKHNGDFEVQNLGLIKRF